MTEIIQCGIKYCIQHINLIVESIQFTVFEIAKMFLNLLLNHINDALIPWFLIFLKIIEINMDYIKF